MALTTKKEKLRAKVFNEQDSMTAGAMQSVSRTATAVYLTAEMLPHMLDNPDMYDAEYIAEVGTSLAAVVAARDAYLPILTAIQQVLSSDPTTAATGRATLDVFNAGKPPFEDRYK